MIIVGLTGVMGSGKTTVLKMFKKLGARILSSDEVVHRLYRDKKLMNKIHRIHRDKSVDVDKVLRLSDTTQRIRLAKKIFSSRKYVRKINSIVHPRVKKEIRVFLRKNRGFLNVVEVPLLFEAHFEDLFDRTVVVAASSGILKKRLSKGGRFSIRDLEERMRWQWPLKKKIARCDFVIDNSKDKKTTYGQVKRLMEVILWKSSK